MSFDKVVDSAALDADLSSIASAIRSKTGLSDELSLEQMEKDIASLQAPLIDVPDYVRAEARRVADAVRNVQTTNCLTFVALSDIHVGSDTQSQASAKHAAQGAKLVSKLVPVDFSAVLGDWVVGSSADGAEQHRANFKKALEICSILCPDLRLAGNHDRNYYLQESYMTAEEANGYIGRYSAFAVKPNTEAERGYFYFDVDGTRIICLNSADMKDVHISDAMSRYGQWVSATQIQWLVDTLGTTGTDGIERIIVLSHHPIHWYDDMMYVLAVLDGYVSGTSGSVTLHGTTISYNFSNKNSAKLVATFHGHNHNFIVGNAGANDIVRIGTPNACFNRNNEYGSSSYSSEFVAKYGETTTYNKTANCANDTAFCVYVVDYLNEMIHAIHYGAGYDRSISYGSAVYYSVTNKLTNVQNDNSASLVEERTAYAANLSVATNYSIKSVVVTMGGVDITATAYANGKINIAEVTGDIVITATASGFVNVIDTVGYSDGQRLSTSSGTLKEQDGYTTTGLIDVTGESFPVTIRTSGANFSYAAYPYASLAFYNADGSLVGAFFANNAGNSYFTPSVDSNGNMTMVLKGSGYGRIKLCGYGSGANLIVTVNEEIN